ncbi:MAG: MFS transporter, partial [Actinobacteria bacterium]|nr:MFS transporter [Actinomycetota bacterium]
MTGGHFLVDFYMNLLPSIVPFLALNMGFSLASLGALVTVMNVTASVLQPSFGVIADRRGYGWLLAFNVAWAAVLMSSLASIKNFYALMAVSTLAALGASFYHPLGSTITTALVSRAKGAAMSAYVTGGSLGTAVT